MPNVWYHYIQYLKTYTYLNKAALTAPYKWTEPIEESKHKLSFCLVYIIHVDMHTEILKRW